MKGNSTADNMRQPFAAVSKPQPRLFRVSLETIMTVVMDKSNLQVADLLAHVSAGDEVVITQNGNPIARVEPIPGSTVKHTPRVPGCDAGKFVVPPEFFDPLPDEVIDEFYN